MEIRTLRGTGSMEEETGIRNTRITLRRDDNDQWQIASNRTIAEESKQAYEEQSVGQDEVPQCWVIGDAKREIRQAKQRLAEAQKRLAAARSAQRRALAERRRRKQLIHRRIKFAQRFLPIKVGRSNHTRRENGQRTNFWQTTYSVDSSKTEHDHEPGTATVSHDNDDPVAQWH